MEEIDRLSNLPESIIHHILSLTDAKYAVQTSVLSKEWKYHWIHVHSLNFDHTTFTDFAFFKRFVLNILQHREPLNLSSLRFHLEQGTGNLFLVRKVIEYAVSRGVAELETNAITTFPSSLFECQTLKTLKLGPCTIKSFSDIFHCLASLTTLQLYRVWFAYDHINNQNNDLFSTFPNLENLSLIKCNVSAWKMSFNISHPRLIRLTISYLDFLGLWLVISAPALKIINLNGTHPLVLFMNKRQTLEKVNIELYPPLISRGIEYNKKLYISHLNRMIRGLCYSKWLKISLSFSKGKFLLYTSNTHGAEMKYEELMETEEDWLSFALPMVRGFSLNELATRLEDML